MRARRSGADLRHSRAADLVALGRTNKEVAAALSLSVRGVEANLSRIYAKLGVRSRTELAAKSVDFHISPEAALFQVPRIAKARNLPEDRVRQLVTDNTQGRLGGLIGEPRVNVLALNLALDATSK